MGQPRPDERDLDGDESVVSPRQSSESLLASKRGTDETKRIETDSSGNLYVNVAAGSITSTELAVSVLASGSALGVTSTTLTTVVTYTAPSDKKISKLSCSGQEYAKVDLVLNTATVETKRMGPDRNIEFLFDMPLNLVSSDILELKVTHFYTGKTSDYTAVIYGA